MSVKVRRIQKIEVDASTLHLDLEEARKRVNKSVSAVCREAEISRPYWYSLVNNKEEAIAEGTLKRLEQVLEASFEIDFGGDRNA